MLEQFDLEKRFGITSADIRIWGKKITGVSFIAAGIGLLLVLFGVMFPGKIMMITGINAGFIGLAMHYGARAEETSVPEVINELYQDARKLSRKCIDLAAGMTGKISRIRENL